MSTTARSLTSRCQDPAASNSEELYLEINEAHVPLLTVL